MSNIMDTLMERIFEKTFIFSQVYATFPPAYV